MTLVTKKDGRQEKFSREKIELACMKAGAHEDNARSVASLVSVFFSQLGIVTVDWVHDVVEKKLMGVDKDAAKAYILYREKRSAMRSVYVGESGISDYIHASKYARYIPEKGRRETYPEAVDRLRAMYLKRFPRWEDQIREAFAFVYRKEVLPSMRSLQFGGDAIEQHHARMYNCSFAHIKRPEVFSEALYLLLAGCGVGYSVQRHHVAQLPSLAPLDESEVRTVILTDTIEGWAAGLRALIEGSVVGTVVEFNYSQIRPKGVPLKTAGGRAPGHIPLKKMLERVREVLLAASGRQLTPFECHSMMCHIAECVLAGGIRRSSLIALFTPDDNEMMSSKTGPWWEHNPHFAMANNSAVFLRSKVSVLDLKAMISKAKEYGEPGFYLTESLEYGTNPCGEIGLDPKNGFAFCNLTEVNCATVTTERDFLARCKAAATIGTLQASFTEFPHLTFASTQRATHEALLGVSLTGIQDNPIRDEWLRAGTDAVRSANSVMASQIGIKWAARLTTVKPSGTASLLLGCVGSGVHPHHAPFYIRRITANPLEIPFQAFRELNPHMCHEKPNGDWVIEFPIAAPKGSKTAMDWSALQMMEEARRIYLNWVVPGTSDRSHDLHHNVSCTVTVDDGDWDDIPAWIWQNSRTLTAMSFLPRLGDKVYAFAPREAVTNESEYDYWLSLARHYRPIDWSKVTEHSDSTDRQGEAACFGGVCEL